MYSLSFFGDGDLGDGIASCTAATTIIWQLGHVPGARPTTITNRLGSVGGVARRGSGAGCQLCGGVGLAKEINERGSRGCKCTGWAVRD